MGGANAKLEERKIEETRESRCDRYAYDLAETRAAALVVSRLRKALDTSLAQPDWQEKMPGLLQKLKLPGARQGVGQLQALLALPIESKTLLFQKILRENETCRQSSKKRLARAWGVSFASGEKACTSHSLRTANLIRSAKLQLSKQYAEYKKAQKLLLLEYGQLPRSSASKIAFNKSHLKDCEQEGYLGLLQAIDRIDPDKRFAGLAARWVERRIRNYIMKTNFPLTAPVNLLASISASSEKSDSRNKFDDRQTTLAIQGLQTPARDWQTIEDSNAGNLEEMLMDKGENPFQTAIRTDLKRLVGFTEKVLSEKQKQVIALRYGVFNREAKETLNEIATVLGISRQQVSRREERALSKIADILGHMKEELV